MENAQALLAMRREVRSVLVVVDTFAAASPGSGENSGKAIDLPVSKWGPDGTSRGLR
jgi:hypothetical protein